MFAFFQKKLTPKCDGEIRHLFWGQPEELLAFGGDNGALTLLNTKTILAEEATCLTVVHSGPREESKFHDFHTLSYPGQTTVSLPYPLKLRQCPTLAPHVPGTVRVVCWNSVERRLGTIDESGCFALWKRENKVWVNEGFCFNAWKNLKDCAASPDGTKICILCSDGCLYLCTVEGQKLWCKDLKRRMRHVLWSPTGLELLLCSEAGEVFFYDSEGFYTHSLHSQRKEKEQDAACATLVPVADIDWYTGDRLQNTEPALAIAYETGCIEVFIGDVQNEPLNFDAHLAQCTAAAWRPTGEVLAVLGRSRFLHPLVPAAREADEDADFIIRFYSTTGNLLHTLVLPEGRRAQAFSWNRTGDKIVVASDCNLLFAKIRPKYAAAYFCSTLVYAAPASQGNKQLLWFWNTDSQSKHLRVVDKVLHIRAAAEGCLVVTDAHSCAKHHRFASASTRYALTVYSNSGDVRELFGSGSTPKHTAFTESHIITADSKTLSLWVYSLLPVEKRLCEEDVILPVNAHSRNFPVKWSSEEGIKPHTRTTAAASNGALPMSCSRVRMPEKTYPQTLRISDAQDASPIVALTANACCFIVARKCGELRRYSLPSVELDYKCNLKSPPLTVQINNDGSRLAVVDVLHVLRLYDSVQPVRNGTRALENHTLDTVYERQHVDHVLWASDHSDSFAIVHKDVFYIAQSTTVEEVVKCSAYLLEYRDLCVRGVYFDKLMSLPARPSINHFYEFRTKPLRDTKAMLGNPLNLRDGLSYIDQRSHPNLWRLLATAALEAFDFTVAEEAYVKCQDYFGLLFIKYLSAMDCSERQMAEVYAYLDNVNEAERRYVSGGRMDLAIASVSSAGDWSRVLVMCRENSCEPKSIQDALRELADSYRERNCWFEAIEIYRQLQNKALLAHALYVTEQYEEMYNLVAGIAEGDDLLWYVGRRLASVGMCDEAVNTFRRAGHLNFEQEGCVYFKDWNNASRFPDDSCSQGDDGTRTQLAERLLQHHRIDHVRGLHRKERSIQKAVKVLLQRALASNADTLPSDPVKTKMMYVLAALLVAARPKKVKIPQGGSFQSASEACFTNRRSLEGGLKLEGPFRAQTHNISPELAGSAQMGSPRSDDVAAACWRGAEAYHLFCLYHEHMARKRFNDAVCVAARLAEYSDYVELCMVYKMVALASYYAQNWQVCSTALMRLDSVQTLPVKHKANIATLAVNIFSRYCPREPAPDDPAAPFCPHCQARLQSWDIMCICCGASFPFCLGSGRSMFVHSVSGSGRASLRAADKSDVARLRFREQSGNVLTCCTCRRNTFTTVARAYENCPLCHTSFTAFSASATEYRSHAENQTSPKNMLHYYKKKE